MGYGFHSHTICGRLTKDIELRTVEEDGTTKYFTYFDLAINHPQTASGGDGRKTDYMTIHATGATAKAIAQQAKKGDYIVVFNADMTVKTRTINKNGMDQQKTDIVFHARAGCFDVHPWGRTGEQKSAGDGRQEAAQQPQYGQPAAQPQYAQQPYYPPQPPAYPQQGYAPTWPDSGYGQQAMPPQAAPMAPPVHSMTPPVPQGTPTPQYAQQAGYAQSPAGSGTSIPIVDENGEEHRASLPF